MVLVAACSLVLASVPPPCASWSGPRVGIGSSHGFPRLLVDGQPKMPIWFKFGKSDDFVDLSQNRRALFEIEQAARVGVPIIAFGFDRKIHGSSAYEGGTDWLFDADHPLDNRTADSFEAVMAAAPSALLFPTVYPYFDSHADGRCTDPSTACEHTLLRDVRNASRAPSVYSHRVS